MKHKLLLLSMITALSSSIAFANGKEQCENWITLYNDVHCTYVSGLTDTWRDGRFIKRYDTTKQVTFTRCITGAALEHDIYQDNAEYFLGSNTIKYSICTDASGDSCEPIGTDTFVISKNGDTFVGEPTSYAIDLANVQDKYQPCVPYNGGTNGNLTGTQHKTKNSP